MHPFLASKPIPINDNCPERAQIQRIRCHKLPADERLVTNFIGMLAALDAAVAGSTFHDLATSLQCKTAANNARQVLAELGYFPTYGGSDDAHA